MRIAIDNVSPGLSTSPGTIGGMRSYLERLLKGMLEIGPHHDYILLTPDWNASFDLPRSPQLEVKPLRSVPHSRVGRVLYERTFYPLAIRRTNCDVLLGLHNTLPPAYGVPSVVVLQSTQYRFVPDAYGFARRAYLQWGVAKAVRQASAVITVSEHSRQDVIRWLRTDPAKIHAVHHGIFYSTEDAQRLPRVAARPYILCVGASYPYKNQFRLIEALSLLRRRGFPHELILAGSYTPEVTRDDLLTHARAFGVEDAVQLPGRVSRGDLEDLYRAADVSVVPSLYETFGFAAVEAMVFGCPVVAARASCLPEIVGDAAELVDPLSADSIAGGIAHVLDVPERRSELIRLGMVRSGSFSWEATAQKTLAILEAVGGPP